jgi:hypothetical protein
MMKKLSGEGLLTVLILAVIFAPTGFSGEGSGYVNCQKIGCTGPHECFDTTSWNSVGCSLECVYGTIHQFRMCSPI